MESFIEHGLIAFGAAQKDRDLIKNDPRLHELANSTHDFDALQSFPGSGKHVECFISWSNGRPMNGKHFLLRTFEARLRGPLQWFRGDANYFFEFTAFMFE